MDFLTNPDRFLERQKDKGLLAPLAVVTVAAAVSSMSAYLTLPYLIQFIKSQLTENVAISQQQLDVILSMTYYGTIVSPFIATFVWWLILSLILYVISGILGGSGSFSTLAKLVSFSYIPPILLSPVTTYLAVESSKHLLYGATKAYIIPSTTVQIAIAAWQAVYWTFAVKNARNLELRKSAITAGIVFVGYAVLTLLSLFFSSLSGTP